ncbi:hypothetical protein V1477_000112 [Vespula maculifrons]|uniref:Uncharacterized protein n=1 Tax=Vespula maculifrons TaxID=7453 RepID=A0ABD2D2S9_VESMC
MANVMIAKSLLKHTFMDSDKILMVDAGHLMINIKTIFKIELFLFCYKIIVTFIKKLVLQFNSTCRNYKQIIL